MAPGGRFLIKGLDERGLEQKEETENEIDFKLRITETE
jgi:hypothetical protein